MSDFFTGEQISAGVTRYLQISADICRYYRSQLTATGPAEQLFFSRSFFTHHNNKTRGPITAEFIEVLYCFAATGRRMRPPMASADGGFYCAFADTLFGGVSRSDFAL